MPPNGSGHSTSMGIDGPGHSRSMASLAGSSCCYADSDRLLEVFTGLQHGGKSIARGTTGLVGDDLESRHREALAAATTVLGGTPAAETSPQAFGGRGDAVRRAGRHGGAVRCRSETAGSAGIDGCRTRTREANRLGRRVDARPRSFRWPPGPIADGSVRYFSGVESTADDGCRRLARRAAATARGGGVGVHDGGRRQYLRRRSAPSGCGGCSKSGSRTTLPIVDFIHAGEYAVVLAACGRHGAGSEPREALGEVRLCRMLKRRLRGPACWPALRRGLRRRVHQVRSVRPGPSATSHAVRPLPRSRTAQRLGTRRSGSARQSSGFRLKCIGMRWTVAEKRQPRALDHAALADADELDTYWGERLRHDRVIAERRGHQRFVVHPPGVCLAACGSIDLAVGRSVLRCVRLGRFCCSSPRHQGVERDDSARQATAAQAVLALRRVSHRPARPASTTQPCSAIRVVIWEAFRRAEFCADIKRHGFEAAWSCLGRSRRSSSRISHARRRRRREPHSHEHDGPGHSGDRCEVRPIRCRASSTTYDMAERACPRHSGPGWGRPDRPAGKLDRERTRSET